MRPAPEGDGSQVDFRTPARQEVTSHRRPDPPDIGKPPGPVSLGHFAAGLAAANLPVLPLLPRSKRPRFKGGYKSATCDPLSVDQHWDRFPDDNIGIRPMIGTVVVDVDPRNGGRTALARLVAEHGR